MEQFIHPTGVSHGGVFATCPLAGEKTETGIDSLNDFNGHSLGDLKGMAEQAGKFPLHLRANADLQAEFESMFGPDTIEAMVERLVDMARTLSVLTFDVDLHQLDEAALAMIGRQKIVLLGNAIKKGMRHPLPTCPGLWWPAGLPVPVEIKLQEPDLLVIESADGHDIDPADISGEWLGPLLSPWGAEKAGQKPWGAARYISVAVEEIPE